MAGLQGSNIKLDMGDKILAAHYPCHMGRDAAAHNDAKGRDRDLQKLV